MKNSLRKLVTSFAATMTLGSAMAQALPTVLAQEEDSADGLVQLDYEVEHEGEAIEGGIVRFALVTDSPFAGILNNMFWTVVDDADIVAFFNESLYGFDENYTINNSGFADIEYDTEAKTVTISIPEGHVWDDGEPITIDDVIFPYYVIGHPDYTGVRYGTDFSTVVGMEEYHSGETDEIEGLERVDDHTLVVHYHTFSSSLYQASGIPNYIEPEHVLGDIPVGEMEDHEYVRVNPVGFGPFKVDSIVPGESITFSKNENYWRGDVNVDGLTLQVVNPTSIVAELRAGNFDIAALPADQYETYADASNFTVLGQETNNYTYIGFKVGQWDEEQATNVMDENRVTSNVALRKAMAHAMDNDAVGTEFYQGLRRTAQSHITPNFSTYLNPEVKAYEYNLELANQILDEAGFIDLDGDGFREDPNGESFELGFASMSGGEVAEPLSQYYIQQWQSIGININLVDGQLMEINSFYERLESDDPAIDVYQGAWIIGGNPNPTNLYGPDARFNYNRYKTDEHTEIINFLNSEEAFEEEARIQGFYDWQEYYMENVPLIPTMWRYAIIAVNERVQQYNIKTGNDLYWTDIYLTAEEPIAE